MIPEIELINDEITGLPIPEEWRNIDDFEGLYEISNYGRVKSLSRMVVMTNPHRIRYTEERIMKHHIANHGYPVVNFTVNKKGRQLCVHVMVANAFIKIIDENANQVNHKDLDKNNPFFLNLERVSGRENVAHQLLTRKKSSKFHGVVHIVRDNRSPKWRASLCMNGGNKCIGFFDTEDEASDAYQNALIEHGIENKYAKI